jgi:hypothetical protein
MKVRFQEEESVIETWVCSIEVPEEIVEEGDEAIERFIKENESGISYDGKVHSECQESLLSISEIETDFF